MRVPLECLVTMLRVGEGGAASRSCREGVSPLVELGASPTVVAPPTPVDTPSADSPSPSSSITLGSGVPCVSSPDSVFNVAVRKTLLLLHLFARAKFMNFLTFIPCDVFTCIKKCMCIQ